MGERLDPSIGNAQVVAPGSAQDPFTDPSASAQPPASAPAGPEPAPAGQPGEGTPKPEPTAPAPAATAPPAAPPAPPPAQTPTEPGPTPVPETVDPPATPAPAQPLSVEDVERARQTAVEETETKWRARQSGQDRQLNDMGRRVEAAEAATETQKQATREVMLAREGLTDEERSRLQTQWNQDDREQKLNAYSESVLDMHSDVEIAHLLIEYRGIPGVTAEALEGITQEERDGFCKDQKIVFLEGGGQPAAAATNGAAQPAPAAPAATPPPEAPAGASAPSDVGGAGAPPVAAPKNENPGADAMAENIGGRGWRDVTFASRPGRR